MMTSNKPYLIRAFYEWIIDNNLTPYVVIDTEHADVEVPTQYIEAGKIILNISPTASNNLLIDNDIIQFNARFSGIPKRIYAPIHTVMAIYARENGRGMVFTEEEQDVGNDMNGDGDKPTPPNKPNKPRKPNLTVVK